MLDKPTPLPREAVAADAASVLQALPAIGRLMVTANHLGATHERIGRVEAVRIVDGWAILEGAEHESRIALAEIASLVIDRTSVMRDTPYPRIELLRADGTEVAHVVGFEGLGPFEAAMAGLGAGTAAAEKPAKAQGERGEVPEGDLGQALFNEAQRAGGPVTIRFARPGFVQFWRGTIEAVKPAMGFVNVMRSDFHLHLRAGAVADWRHVASDTGHEYAALGADGAEIGLAVLAERSFYPAEA